MFIILKTRENRGGRRMDARTRYTKIIIQEEFLNLLEKKSVEQITVKEICAKADINRATFYKYYDNAFDLLSKLESETLSKLKEELSTGTDLNFIDIYRLVLYKTLENRRLYELLFRKMDDERFEKDLYDLCYGVNFAIIKKYFAKLPENKQQWVYYFIAEGLAGVMKQWIRGGYKESVDELVDLATKLVESINSKLPGML